MKSGGFEAERNALVGLFSVKKASSGGTSHR
jgi:hypothetical protein